MKQNSNLNIIGVTGRIATGKSSFAEAISKLGYTIIDADAVYHKLLKTSLEMQNKIKEHFGSLDRNVIIKRITEDKIDLKKLNDITHSFVVKEIKKKINKYKNKNWVLDVPIPVEEGFKDLCDLIVVTDCNLQTQLDRLKIRNGLNEKESLKLINMQMERENYLGLADCIVNTENLSTVDLSEVVDKIFE